MKKPSTSPGFFVELNVSAQPQVPTAPHAEQKSQPSLRITVKLPHSAHSESTATLLPR